MNLDKDILIKGNKIYSKSTCVFVPERMNYLFVKNDNDRGEYPIGVYYNKRDNKYVSCCKYENKTISLGYFNTPEEAFMAYKRFKEKVIKEVADKYKDFIPKELYNTLYNYEVEITD